MHTLTPNCKVQLHTSFAHMHARTHTTLLPYASTCTRLPVLWPVPQAINTGADIIECSFAKVDLDRVLGIHAFSLDRLLIKDPEFLVGPGGWRGKAWRGCTQPRGHAGGNKGS